MSHFILTYGYNDTPERAERRPEHLEHLAKLQAEGSLLLAGPLADLSGGVIVLTAADAEAAQALVERDPYTRHGVTRDRQLKEWKITVGL
ncbi:YciI family protein [Paractinoplanes hotanensis]|uniref:YciI family protein n=1 Tax=Paractinoplanes hotanensis TaxID=2906497 RepID=A0ABT0Y9P4_9ACTN|nr:YciI family protein [Actinoplanes hotanensis]MCM4082767.1 YciI family protein [Actinoplanes hotanensis]